MTAHCQLLIAILTIAILGQDVVSQYPPEITDIEGKDVTLKCNISTLSTAFWYKQYPDGNLHYLFRIYTSGKVDKSPDLPERFTAELIKENKVIKLQILGAVVGDSAVYYCALEPTLLQEGRFPVQKLSRQSYLALTHFTWCFQQTDKLMQ
uniref:Immunoglobulin domain-containing protein n=1 Tax=Callorhinchus milii TaxID=7868 RepID=A0A4W3GP86_CALMI